MDTYRLLSIDAWREPEGGGRVSRADYLAEHVYRCPQCGRFVLAEATGTFFDCSEKMPEEEMGGCAIAAFCDERCADKFHGRAP